MQSSGSLEKKQCQVCEGSGISYDEVSLKEHERRLREHYTEDFKVNGVELILKNGKYYDIGFGDLTFCSFGDKKPNAVIRKDGTKLMIVRNDIYVISRIDDTHVDFNRTLEMCVDYSVDAAMSCGEAPCDYCHGFGYI